MDCLSYNGDNLDKELSDSIDNSIDKIVPWYILASYSYYEEEDPILSNSCFRKLTKRMIANWDEIKHEHKDYIKLDRLKYSAYISEYPPRVGVTLESLRGAFKFGTKYRK